MHPNTFKVSILRDPLANFISSWKYYNDLTKVMRNKINEDILPKIDGKQPDWYKEIEQFVTKPFEYLSPFAYSHSAYLFTFNPQLIFFGYPSYLLQNTEKQLRNLVDNWITSIDNDFDHILILEGNFLACPFMLERKRIFYIFCRSRPIFGSANVKALLEY